MNAKTARTSRAGAGLQRSAKLAALPKIRGGVDDSDAGHLVYDRVRLGIMSALAVAEQLTFKELKALCNITDGNLSAHARKLEDAGLIQSNKSFEDRRPKTEYRLSAAGRKALERYLAHMEAVIKATRS